MQMCLSRTRLIAHETIVAGALGRNRRLLKQLRKGTRKAAGAYRSPDRYRRRDARGCEENGLTRARAICAGAHPQPSFFEFSRRKWGRAEPSK